MHERRSDLHPAGGRTRNLKPSRRLRLSADGGRGLRRWGCFVLVDLKRFGVVAGMCDFIGTLQVRSGFVVLEPEVEIVVCLFEVLLASSAIAEHKVVMGGQVLRIDRQDVLELINGLIESRGKELNSTHLVAELP